MAFSVLIASPDVRTPHQTIPKKCGVIVLHYMFVHMDDKNKHRNNIKQVNKLCKNAIEFLRFCTQTFGSALSKVCVQ